MFHVSFRMLGEFEVRAGNRLIAISPRQRIVLATLLMVPNQVIPVERLIDSVWDSEPPSTARSQIQICISALRRTLGKPGLINTGLSGYSIKVRPDQLDYIQFDQALARARTAEVDGRLAEAVAELDVALQLWRGSALIGVPGRATKTLANRLEERRVMARENRISIRLSLGAHDELIDELLEMTADYPLRERPYGLLMLALYRAGRQAQALTVYHEARRILLDELGIEPGESLRNMERAILSHDQSLDLAEVAVPAPRCGPTQPPCQLPADIADFVGRADLVEEIVGMLTSTNSKTRSTPGCPVAVITGQPGCGKSTVALHIAHLVRDQFPSGQLYVDMRGSTDQPTLTRDVLSRFLRALGVPGEVVPVDADERVTMLRSIVASRRTLLVLDDVLDEEQISDLLPGAIGPAVLISSRSRLPAISGADRFDPDLLTEHEAVQLLKLTAGKARVDGDREGTLNLVRLCGRLPLALRIAGVRLAAHPHWTVSTLADRMSDEEHRLDELSHGSVEVRSLLAMVYKSVGPRARHLFRLIGTLDLRDITPLMAAALLDTDLGEASRQLDELAMARLLNAEPDGEGRQAHYSIHSLVSVFAAECARKTEDEDALESEQRAAAERLLSRLLTVAGRRVSGATRTGER
jgi:DNA-binding SARP family transcriptional activator/energy-coupling factor transporter ATP-binding protein EcfA2